MELKQINELLKNVAYPKGDRNLTFIEKQYTHRGVSDSSYNDGVQGESDDYYEIYRINAELDLYIRFDYSTDSYGESPNLTAIQFVKPKEQKVTNFETI